VWGCGRLLWGALTALPMQGDGLEFKRHFLKIKGKLSDVVSSQKVWLPPP